MKGMQIMVTIKEFIILNQLLVFSLITLAVIKVVTKQNYTSKKSIINTSYLVARYGESRGIHIEVYIRPHCCFSCSCFQDPNYRDKFQSSLTETRRFNTFITKTITYLTYSEGKLVFYKGKFEDRKGSLIKNSFSY